MNKYIALIGAGYWGKNHLRNLYKLGVLHTVIDINSELLNEKALHYPHANFVKDEDIILKSSDIKAVVIATPAKLHYELTKRYLLAGKDILVEKPLSLNVRDGEKLVEIAREAGKVLMVGHILQYHPAVIKLKEIIDSGEVGEIRYIYSNRLNLGKLRIEENVLWSFAPHDISIVLMLMNDKQPIKVTAFGGSYITEGVFDTTVTNLEFENDVKSHIFVSWLHPYKEQKLILVGNKGMIVFNDLSKEKLVIYPHKVDFENGKIPVAQKAEHYSVHFEGSEPLKNELLHFIDCVKNRKIPRTDGNEGLRVLKAIEAAENSLKNIK